MNPGKAYVITSDGRDVLEEHRQGILEWIEYAVRGRGDVASLLRWIRSLPARKGLALHLVHRLQGSDDPEFWETLVDVALKAHPDRGRLLGHLMAEAEDEDVVAANDHVAGLSKWEEEGGGWQIVDRISIYITPAMGKE